MQIRRLIRRRAAPGRATLLILGLLLLRALVPTGFMLAQVDGGVSVVLCQPEAMPAGHGHHHFAGADSSSAHHAGDHASDPAFHGDSGCVFAQSAGALLLPTLPVLAGTTPILNSTAPRRATQTLPSVGPPRQQSPRGPPSLV